LKLTPNPDPIKAAQGYGSFSNWASFDYIEACVVLSDDKVMAISDFNLPNAAVTSSPLQVASEELNNDVNTTQTMSFSFSKTLQTTKTVSFSSAQQISGSTTFQTGIPFFAQGKVQVGAQVSFNEGGSSSSADTTQETATFPISVPGNSCYKAIAIITSSHVNVEVTFSMSRTFGYTDGNRGVWPATVLIDKVDTAVAAQYSGVNDWNLDYTVEDCDSPGKPSYVKSADSGRMVI